MTLILAIRGMADLFINVKFACCSARIIGAWTPMLNVSKR